MNDTKRDINLDIIKGLLIILVVYGHISYIGSFKDLQVEIKNVIYHTHIPLFFLISGLLVNFKEFRYKSILYLLIPYFIFYSLYSAGLLIASNLNFPITVTPSKSLTDFIRNLFFHPTGVYWFLHILILLNLCCIISHKLFFNNLKSKFIFYIFLNLILLYFNLVKLNSSMFFVFGLVLNISDKKNFIISRIDFIFLLFTLLIFLKIGGLPLENLDSLIFNTLIFIILYNFCAFFIRYLGIIKFLGLNTFIVLVFHPFSLLTCKSFTKYLIYIDNLGFLYSFISVFFTCFFFILCSYSFDKFKLSFYIFGRKSILKI